MEGGGGDWGRLGGPGGAWLAGWTRFWGSQPAQIPGTPNFVPKILSRNLSRLGELLNTQKNVHFSGSRDPHFGGVLRGPILGGPEGPILGGPETPILGGVLRAL